MEDSIAAGSRRLLCPLCEAYDLRALGRNSAGCEACGSFLSGALLVMLRRIIELPDVVGRHPCECGHPEMRRLPDGVYRCPACGSEVLPISYP